MKRVLAIICLVVTLGVLQGYGKSINGFFSSNNNDAYKVLLKAAHPINNFVSGTCEVHNGYVIVSLYSEGGISGNSYKTKIKFKFKHGVFSNLQVIEDNDPATPFLWSSIIKKIAEELCSDYAPDSLKKIERVYNKLIKHMDVEELCSAYLSVRYLAYK